MNKESARLIAEKSIDDEKLQLPRHVRAWTRLSRSVLFLERMWSAIGPTLAVIGVFAILALFEIPRHLGFWGHWALLGVAAAGVLAALWLGFRRWHWPTYQDALSRLEKDSDLRHRPLTHLADRQASNLVDPFASRLWDRHRQRLLDSIGKFNLNLPLSDFARRDPFALRILILVLVALGFAFAWDMAPSRLAVAFMPARSATTELTAISLEAWITPPDYTRLAPVALKYDNADTGADTGTPSLKPLEIPMGSRLLVQVQGISDKAKLLANGTEQELEALDELTQRAEAKLTSGNSIEIKAGGESVSWPITLRADLAPKATLDEPRVTDRSVMRLTYGATDDFGTNDMRLTVTKGTESFEISLPVQAQDPTKVHGSSYQDLTAHPWAGVEVELRVVARDALGQIGASAPVPMILPERKFYHPVARAIVEQRKRLSQDAATAQDVARRLTALRNQPAAYDDNIVTYLALDMASRRLTGAYQPASKIIGEIQQLLWDTALALEDGGVSLAMRELRELQKALEDALARGASDEEIERLMNELQQAMNDYLQQLAQQLQKAIEQGMQPGQLDPNSLRYSQQDLNKMLEEARRMAQNGARESAQQMLSQLQNLLENLQMGMPMMGQRNAQGQQMMNDLGRIMQQQQQLLEETFRMQRGQQPGDQGQGQGEMSDQGMGEGAQAQEALRQRLGDLMRRFSNMTGNIPQGMGMAERSMRDATGSLRQSDLPGAAQAQNDALQQLQQGLQQMSEQLQQQMGAQRGPGQRDPMDPFGRAMTEDEGPGGDAFAREGTDRVPLESQMDKSRRIFEELRQRRNESSRPKLERDYIDRLLRQF